MSDQHNIEKRSDYTIEGNSRKYIEFAVRDANTLWKKIVSAVKKNPDIENWDDGRKIDYFYEDNKEFYKEFPIVCRYMVTMGQYSSRAFSKYLSFKAMDMKNMPPPHKRKPGYIEDKWVQREATYIKELWKSYKKGQYAESEAKLVWKHAYESLKKEFDGFRDTYKQTELKIKEENAYNNKELIKETLMRILNKDHQDGQKPIIDTNPDNGVIQPKPGHGKLDINKKQQLRDQLLQNVLKQREEKVMEENKSEVPT